MISLIPYTNTNNMYHTLLFGSFSIFLFSILLCILSFYSPDPFFFKNAIGQFSIGIDKIGSFFLITSILLFFLIDIFPKDLPFNSLYFILLLVAKFFFYSLFFCLNWILFYSCWEGIFWAFYFWLYIQKKQIKKNNTAFFFIHGISSFLLVICINWIFFYEGSFEITPIPTLPIFIQPWIKICLSISFILRSLELLFYENFSFKFLSKEKLALLLLFGLNACYAALRCGILSIN